MKRSSDTRFDPNYAAQMLLDVAHQQTLEHLLQKVVCRVAERPDVAGAQIWLIERGDLCATCPRRPECPDQSRCLHLVAGKRVLGADSASDVPRFDDLNARMPLGVGPLGKAATTGQQILLMDLDKQPVTITRFDWQKQGSIRGLAAAPILFNNAVLGVFSVVTREGLPDQGRTWSQIFADHIGSAIANARAFEEIQRLKAQLEMQNAYLQEEVVEAKAFGGLIGQSAALRQVISQIDLVAPTEASVLILGDTGTGKELVAHEIHRRSQRKDGPLVRVNCASISKDLFESEFFGHVRGAFTGAIRDRPGRFETAEGGTLFLDEVGEIPLEMQGKLLRVLQERRYERVGEDRTRCADVRIVAATNRDLKKWIAAGRFREDLYYRLHVFPIRVPPLGERKDDIPLLVKHFVGMSVRELRCQNPRLTRAGITALQNYDWPGNVRELRNVIERAVILARGGPLHFALPTAGISALPVSSNAPQGIKADGELLTEAEFLRREYENLAATLAKTAWKIKGADGAAELLGIKPTTLLSRMKRMGLKRPGT